MCGSLPESLKSLMNIVLTLEGMWVLLFVIDSLYLDSCVVQVILPSEQVSYLGKCLKRFD